MTDTTLQPAAAEPVRKVGFLLGVGIFLLPIIFVWFLLRKGHTTRSRVIGFIWTLLVVIFAFAGGENTAPVGAGNVAKVTSTSAEAAVEEAVPEEGAKLTGPQRNAVRSAKSYLSMSGFSREGLIQQLSSSAGEGYDVGDATVAVDSLNVDWNENAVKSAKSYLSMSGFSCQGLIDQLSSSAGEKYTVEQATYGARQAGAC